MNNLNELDYEPDETQRAWHFYNKDGEPLMVVNITYKNGHTDPSLEKLIKLHAKGFRIKHIQEN